LKALLEALEARIADEVANALRASEASEDSLQQRVKDAEKAQRDMVEKCRLFEKQLEQSEGSHKIEAAEHTVAMNALKQNLQELETERKRLQDEVESLETSLSDANKAAVAAQWQVSRF
jgi:chromosome segregation ATPase